MCKYLKDHEKGFIHVMKNEKCNPDYTVSWASVAAELNGINVELPTMFNFFAWSIFLLPYENEGESMLYKVTNPQCYFRAPPNYNNWKISNYHSINLGYGEDFTGAMVKHPGVWFAGYGFSQSVPH